MSSPITISQNVCVQLHSHTFVEFLYSTSANTYENIIIDINFARTARCEKEKEEENKAERAKVVFEKEPSRCLLQSV